ncbi:DUF4251 domain-containing protein [Gelidibacter salicanalis]|uniref:DUF4251 domain-containing protein n=1 Tax=Gelidibacter salicanalis TaxID=291193 RepID=A0A934KS04_9FLAO|nr:DUF4251 domain-containing protein [Gelidibacter salicanalis]MBJ7882474.1 DUF4251 domain-containing protein [Gelidibacter salicanalis]
MKNLLVYSALCLMILSCGSSKEFTAQEDQAYENLKDLVASRSLEIISNSASPFASAAFSRVANSNILGPGNSANHIDITTNANKLTIKGDSISGYLPFFGEQNFGGGYNNNKNSIEFNEVPKDYKVTHDDQKHAVEISFKIDDKYRNSEHYDMMIILYPNLRSTIRVQSTTRSSIEYSGRVSPLEEAKE